MHSFYRFLCIFWQLSNSLARTSTSAKRAAGSSSRDAVFAGSDADTTRLTGDSGLQKVKSGLRISPFVSSEHPRSFSARVTSNEHTLESTIKKIEGLNVSNEERLQ